MKRRMVQYRKQLSVIAILGLAFLLLLAVRVGRSNTSSLSAQNEVWPVENKTQAFQVVSSEINNGVVRLALKNGYSKTINGFTIGGSETSGVQVDFTATDSAIAPGETYQYKVAVQSVQSSSGETIDNKRLKLAILSVVFDDGTSDGDDQAIAQMKNRRHGEKVQLKRIIPLIEQALASSVAPTPEILSRLKSQISSLPVEPENGQPSGIIGGLYHGKEDALTRIRDLEEKQSTQGNVDFRKGLLAIKKQFEKKAPKL